MRTTKIIAGMAVMAALALAGCGGGGNTTTPAAAPATASTAAPTPTGQGVAKFGDTVKFPDGLSITATATLHPASAVSAGAVDGKIVVIEVKVTNGSNKPINAALTAYPKVTYGASGEPAGTAADSSLTTGTVGNLLPGETGTARTGAGIPAAGLSDVRLEFMAPDMMDQPAVFKGAVQ